MALADFLSAMRVLILDGPTLPIELPERRADLARRFTRLSSSEIDDLAALPPERLQVYSDLVFAGERSTLRWIFPLTFAAIHAMEPAADDLGLARELHRHRPWQSASTRELAGHFQSYILEQRGDLTRKWGGLADLVDFERVDLEVFYAADVPHTPWNGAEESRFRGLSVEALMNQKVLMPPYAVLRAFKYDVLGVADHWRAHQTFPSPLPPPVASLVACGRSPENQMPAWVRLTTAGHHSLNGVGSKDPITINEIAGLFLEASATSSDLGQERLFADFYADLVRWLSAGILLLVPAD